MNQSQRNFLVDTIQKKVDLRIKALRDSEPEPPSLDNYLTHAVMSNQFQIKPIEQIKEMIRQRVLSLKKSESLLGDKWHSSRDTIHLKPHELFVIPEEYAEKLRIHKEKVNSIQQEISEIVMVAESLITRIRLASNSTLEGMIKEVDDMGDISLMDTTLKRLN